MPKERQLTEAEILQLLAEYEPSVELHEFSTWGRPAAPRRRLGQLLAVAAVAGLMAAALGGGLVRPAEQPHSTSALQVVYQLGSIPATKQFGTSSFDLIINPDSGGVRPRILLDANSWNRPSDCGWSATINMTLDGRNLRIGSGREWPGQAGIIVNYQLPSGTTHAPVSVRAKCVKGSKIRAVKSFAFEAARLAVQGPRQQNVVELHYKGNTYSWLPGLAFDTHWTGRSSVTTYFAPIIINDDEAMVDSTSVNGVISVFDRLPPRPAGSWNSRAGYQYRFTNGNLEIWFPKYRALLFLDQSRVSPISMKSIVLKFADQIQQRWSK